MTVTDTSAPTTDPLKKADQAGTGAANWLTGVGTSIKSDAVGAYNSAKSAVTGTPNPDASTDTTTDDPNKPGFISRAGSWISDTFGHMGVGGWIGAGLGGALAFLVGNAFGGGGWIGMLLTLVMAPILIMLGAQGGRSVAGGFSSSPSATPDAGLGYAPAQPGPYLSPELLPPGPYEFHQALLENQYYPPNVRITFHSVRSHHHGSTYIEGPPPTPYRGGTEIMVGGAIGR